MRLTSNRVAWFILALALAFSSFVRWRLAEFPLERDEGEYAYAGQLLLQGVPPYSLAYNMKLPGTYLAYAGLMAVFGETTVGVHIGLLAVNLVTIVLLFCLARALFDSLTAASAAACFAVLSTSPSVLGMAGHATHFVTLFAVAGTWALWRAMQSDRQWSFLAAGVLLGLGFLMKQQGIFFLCFGGLATVLSYSTRRPFLSRRHLATCLIFAVGAIAPFALCCLWLWSAGTFGAFWFWTVDYARAYVAQIPLVLAAELFWNSTRDIIGANWPIGVLAIVGALVLAPWRGIDQRRAFVFGFLVFSFLCVCPGFYFRPHYFIVLLPAAAILAGVGSIALVRGLSSRLLFERSSNAPQAASHANRARRRKVRDLASAANSAATGRRLALVLAALVPTLLILLAVWQQRAFYFFWTPTQACRQIYGVNPFVECPVIAEYLQRHCQPDDRIAVLGSEPEIFFYARRLSATGYIYTYPLVESQPFARKMQDEMIAEIEAASPKFLVVVNVPTSWLFQPGFDAHILKWLEGYAAAHYRPVGLIDVLPSGPSEYRWDSDVVGAKPRSVCHLWVLQKGQ